MSLIKPSMGNTAVDQVLLTVIGAQRDAQGEEHKIELFTHGRRYAKNGVD